MLEMIETLTLYEAIDAYLSTSDQLEMLHSYWLSATFAVVLASFAARKHLNLPVTLTISVLYFLGTLMILTKAELITATMRIVIDNGPDQLSELHPDKMMEEAHLHFLSRVATYIIGFLAAQMYLWFEFINNRNQSS